MANTTNSIRITAATAQKITQRAGQKISHREFLQLHRFPERTAAAADLRYIKSGEGGIERVTKNGTFLYVYKGKTIRDEKTLSRIKRLAIPPAWTNVWICSSSAGHIQATGVDVRNRKQYRYHAQWNAIRSDTKFHKLYEFGKALPAMRTQLEQDIRGAKLSERKVIALVILLMERTYIRIGNESYEKMNGSYGLTTLKDKHVDIQGDGVRFSFKGKKGIHHTITLRNKRLARMVKECRDVPGKELFQYYDEDNNRHSIDSGSVNQYIREASGQDFTAKDFRLWAGSLNMLRSLRAIDEAITSGDTRKKVIQALDEVSMKLGNTRTVCRKYYVHPGLIRLYEDNNLKRYLQQLDETETRQPSGLTQDEEILMRILKSCL